MKNNVDVAMDNLIIACGITDKEGIEKLSDKISITIAAHKSAGTDGYNPLCKVNRLLNEIITTIDMVKNSKN